MSLDRLNQLVAQLTVLQNKLAEKDAGLNRLISQQIEKISTLQAIENPILELKDLYLALNAPEYTSLYHRLKIRKNVEQLNILVLAIIHQKLDEKQYKLTKYKKSLSDISKPRSKLFISIAILGTVLAALSGAAAIQSVFSAFLSVISFPAGLIVGTQIIFASVAVFAFYFFELNTIGKSLGIRPFELGLLFKQYSEQEHSFKESFRVLFKQFQSCTNFEDYEALKTKFLYLKNMYDCFQHKLTEAEQAKKPNIFKTIAQKILTILGAAVFGVLSALGAQPVLIAFLPLLLGATAATGPIGLGVIATVMGVCALAGAGLFVFMERKGERIINKLWGTPTKTIDKLISRGSKINEIVSDIEISKANTFKHLQDKKKGEFFEEAYYNLQYKQSKSYDDQKKLPQLFPLKTVNAGHHYEVEDRPISNLTFQNPIAVK